MNQTEMTKEINMKTIITAAAITTFSTAAMAADLGVIGNVEYLLEAEALETTVGVEYDIFNGVVLTAVVDASFNFATDDANIDGATIAAQYGLTNNIATYVAVDVDGDFEYEELTVGVGFRF